MDLAVRMLSNTSTRLHRSPFSLVNYLSGDRADITPAMGIQGPVKEQTGQGLGQRMKKAIFAELEEADQVILVGSDLLGLDEYLLKDAFDLLEDHDLVLSPTEDGGFGLIGMKQAWDVFSGITYSQASVFEETIQRIEGLGLTWAQTKTLTDIDVKEDLIAQQLGSRDFTLLGAGEYNINYRFGDYVMRINLASQMDLGSEQIVYEYKSLKVLAETGVVPRVYEVQRRTEWIPYGLLYMDYLPGEPLDYDRDLAVAADLLAKVHNCPIQGDHWIRADKPFLAMMKEFRTMYSYYQSWSDKDPQVEKTIDGFLRIAESLGLDDDIQNPCIINTELNNRNFLINPGKASYLIDWEKPIIGEAEQDLAHFLVPTTTYWKTDKILSSEEREDFLRSYERHRSIDRDRLKKYLLFNTLRGVTWCAMAQREYAGERNISHPDTRTKIDEFLSPPFLDRLYEEFYKEVDEERL